MGEKREELVVSSLLLAVCLFFILKFKIRQCCSISGLKTDKSELITQTENELEFSPWSLKSKTNRTLKEEEEEEEEPENDRRNRKMKKGMFAAEEEVAAPEPTQCFHGNNKGSSLKCITFIVYYNQRLVG